MSYNPAASDDEIQTPPARKQLKYLSHTHEAIAIWLIENPTGSLAECAAAHEVTPAWLSQIIHSDLFQLRLANLRKEGYEVPLLTLHERLAGVAALCLERLAEKVSFEPDVDKLRSTADMTLKRLGYGTPHGAVIINNNQGASIQNTTVSKSLINDARDLISRVHENTPSPARTDDHDALDGLVVHKELSVDDPFSPE